MPRLPSVSILWVFALALLLCVSTGAAVYLYRAAIRYYRDLQSIRLDPYGLAVYPTGVPQNLEKVEKPIVVFFGDSRAQQWSFPEGAPEFVFVNRGIHSQTTVQVLGRMPSHVLPLKPAVVVLQVGVNDLKMIALFPAREGEIIANCKKHIESLVTAAVANGSHVILTTIFPAGEVPLERRLLWSSDAADAVVEVNRFIATLASDRVTVVDSARVLAPSRESIDPRFSRDFLHLNAAGYEALNWELLPLLRKVTTQSEGAAR